ncbi:MAG: sigma factor-like helix-turn-helix DNA-binding protein, partial [Gemmatimonadales bacterium]|nr:sigma factor-like helix-turn-helix DNA-binding protein [Gemmatimonadales bacterium]
PPDAAAIGAEEARALSVALEELPAPQRTALELAFFDGLSHAEIATRLAEPLGTVKGRIRTAMTRLRTALAGLGPERSR